VRALALKCIRCVTYEAPKKAWKWQAGSRTHVEIDHRMSESCCTHFRCMIYGGTLANSLFTSPSFLPLIPSPTVFHHRFLSLSLSFPVTVISDFLNHHLSLQPLCILRAPPILKIVWNVSVVVPRTHWWHSRTGFHRDWLFITNSMTLSPRANYTDWATATCWRNLVSTFVDRGVSRVQRGGSPTVFNLSFLDRSRYFSFK
jgi:hypothetical protein